jgi:hypothetical protein
MLTRRRALANGLLAAFSLVLDWPGRLTGFQAATAHPISLTKSMRRENCPFIRDLETEVMESLHATNPWRWHPTQEAPL